MRQPPGRVAFAGDNTSISGRLLQNPKVRRSRLRDLCLKEDRKIFQIKLILDFARQLQYQKSVNKVQGTIFEQRTVEPQNNEPQNFEGWIRDAQSFV